MATTRRLLDIARQVANLVLSFTQLLVVFLPALGVGIPISEATSGAKTPVQPAPYAFGIWFVIYVACIGYGIYQALPERREDGLLRRVGWFTAAAFLATTAWALVAQSGGGEALLFALILLILIPALAAFIRLPARLSGRERYLVELPIGLLAGWVTLATFVSAASILGLSSTGSASAVVIVAGVAGALLTLASRVKTWFAVALVWGFIGIVAENLPGNAPVALTAGVMAALVALALLLSRRWPEYREG
ncbi:MAG: hypothetical protein ACYC2Y_00260 [Armatimonadota bacterium]